MICPNCNGRKIVESPLNLAMGGGLNVYCGTCDGYGNIIEGPNKPSLWKRIIGKLNYT